MSTYQRNFMNEKRNNWLAHVANWSSWLKLTRPIIHILHEKNTTLRRQESFFTFQKKHQASINFNSIYYVCNKPKFLFENEKKKNRNFLRWFIQIHLHHTKFTNNITTDFLFEIEGKLSYKSALCNKLTAEWKSLCRRCYISRCGLLIYLSSIKYDVYKNVANKTINRTSYHNEAQTTTEWQQCDSA